MSDVDTVNDFPEIVVEDTILRMENGVVYMSFKPGAEHSLASARLVNAKLTELLGQNVKRLYLVDGTDLSSMESEARRFYASGEATLGVKALAIVAGSTTAAVIGNLYAGLNQPPYPTKMFTSKDSALSWLMEQK